MSTPDYQQRCEDHSCILILVKNISPESSLSSKSYDKIYNKISQVNEIKISDAQGLGLERIIKLRFKKDHYDLDDNKWGDFQVHRKLLGIITIGKISHNPQSSNDLNKEGDKNELKVSNDPGNDLDDITAEHLTVTEMYSNTVLDSRCFIFRGSPEEPQPMPKDGCKKKDGCKDSPTKDSSGEVELAPKDGCKNSPTKDSRRDSVKTQMSFDTIIDGNSSDLTSELNKSDMNHSTISKPDSNNSVVEFPPPLVSSSNQTSGKEMVSSPSDEGLSQRSVAEPESDITISLDTSSSESGSNESLDQEEDGGSGNKETLKKEDSMEQIDNPLFKKCERKVVTTNPLSIPRRSSFSNVRSVIYDTISNVSNEISDSSLASMESKLEGDIKDLVSSLFWVLESKRLDRSYEKIGRSSLLMAPFEPKTLVGVDNDSRYKKRCLGRIKKNLGDLSLLAGLPCDALTHYTAAIDVLKSVSDWLWLAAAIEGQCVASLAITHPMSGRRKMSLQRNSSLPPSKFKQCQELSRTFGSSTLGSSTLGSSTLGSSTLGSSTLGSSTFGSNVELKSPDSPPSVDDKERRNLKKTLSMSIRGRSSVHSSPSTLDPNMAKALGKTLVEKPIDFYDKFKECCCHYAKFKNAAVIEMECSFKAGRVLTMMEKYMNAAEFIQNAVFISLNQSNEEQIHRLMIISSLYTEIGFHRKSAFYLRFAALKAVSLNVTNPNWLHCYQLLLQALDGYELTLDPLEYERRVAANARDVGWAGIHIQILQELITTARRMNSPSLAIRHLSFLLHCFCDYLTPAQRKDFSLQLQLLSRDFGEGAPITLNTDNGTIIPCVNMTKFPRVTSFLVKNLPSHLRPHVMTANLIQREGTNGNSSLPGIKQVNDSSSPFIFTPLLLNRPLHSRRPSIVKNLILDFKWVQNEPVEVSLEAYNNLPIDLIINHMKLLTDGIVFQINPISLTIAPESGPFPIILTGTPRASGFLHITGYATHVLGIKSNCLLRDLPDAKKMKLPVTFSVEIVPPLPLLSLSCPDLDKSSIQSPLANDIDFITNGYSLSLFAGEKKSVMICLSNSSSEPTDLIELINIKVLSKLKKNQEKSLISLKSSSISENLPLKPGDNLEYCLEFFGFSDFVAEDKSRSILQRRKSGTSTSRPSSASASGSSNASGVSNSPAHAKKQPLQIATALNKVWSDLQTSSSASNLSAPKVKDKRTHSMERNNQSSPVTYPSKVIDVVIEFEYSGGAGLASGFCRKSAVSFNIEIKPSVLLTHWHVLPAEVPNRCFLVLDVLNATTEEMELKYSSNKSMLIESKETCRIPVPIERCTLTIDEKDGNDRSLISPVSLSAKCKAHLISQVHLEYNLMGSCESSGTASVESIPWSSFMLETILMSSVQWELSANGNLLPSDKPEIVCSVGEFVTFNISLLNQSDHPLRFLTLWISLYQEQPNGYRNYSIETKRALHGTDKVNIDKVEARNSFKHDVSYIFLHSGQYKMDIQCAGYDETLMAVSNSPISSRASTFKLQEQSLRAELMIASKTSYNENKHFQSALFAATASNHASASSGAPSLWTFSPSPTISVTV